MSAPVAEPERRIRLEFRRHDELDHADQPVRSDLSTVAANGRCLWTANDELATLERLVRQEDGGYGDHEAFPLAELFDLPQGADGEMDIEGLDIADGYLWIAGSHSLTREKPKPGDHDAAEALARLTEVEHHPNRHFLGRVPLVEGESGLFAPKRQVKGADGDRRRHSGAVKIKSQGNQLARQLRGDVHIARFLAVPAKENGFDIEGIVARGNRVLLGLRGPVLRGWAMLIEVAIKEPEPGHLKLKRIGRRGGRYLKHFLDLDGLGIRELTAEGDALLILAGPTMDLDGPIALYRWPGAFDAHQGAVVTSDRLELVRQLPVGRGDDHPEGICWLPDSGAAKELLVVHDSPAKHRLHGNTAIDADVFGLGRTASSRHKQRLNRRR